LVDKDAKSLSDVAEDVGRADDDGKADEAADADRRETQNRRVGEFFLMGLYHNDQEGNNSNSGHIHDLEKAANQDRDKHADDDHIQGIPIDDNAEQRDKGTDEVGFKSLDR